MRISGNFGRQQGNKDPSPGRPSHLNCHRLLLETGGLHFSYTCWNATTPARHSVGQSLTVTWFVLIFHRVLTIFIRTGAHFSKVSKTFWAWKAICKTPTWLCCKAGLFICWKQIKTAKFRASRSLCFEDTKRIMSLKMCPKSFRTFKKKALGGGDRPVCNCNASASHNQAVHPWQTESVWQDAALILVALMHCIALHWKTRGSGWPVLTNGKQP